MRGHMQCRDTFAWIQEHPLKRGTAVYHWICCPEHRNIMISQSRKQTVSTEVIQEGVRSGQVHGGQCCKWTRTWWLTLTTTCSCDSTSEAVKSDRKVVHEQFILAVLVLSRGNLSASLPTSHHTVQDEQEPTSDVCHHYNLLLGSIGGQ